MLAPPKLKLSLSLVGSKTITGSMLLLHQSQHLFTTFRYLFGPSQDFHCSSLKLPSRHRFKGSSKVCKGFSKAIKGSSKVFSKVLQRFFFKGVSIWIKGFSKGFHQFSEVCPLSSELWSSPLGHREPSAKGSAGSARRPRASQSDDTEYGMQCAMCTFVQCAMCHVYIRMECKMRNWDETGAQKTKTTIETKFLEGDKCKCTHLQKWARMCSASNTKLIAQIFWCSNVQMFQCSKFQRWLYWCSKLIVEMFQRRNGVVHI